MTDFRIFPKLRDGMSWGLEAITILNRILQGKLNNVQEVTLTAGVATTVITDSIITTASKIGLMPMTANAAAALGTTYFDAPVRGQITVNHANNGQTDRTFRYDVMG